ncbi:hypothetical protein GCM10009681_04740 [Luedemannella helvata]|uniref:Uncharacterized protein n=1 Tax=Luedemannella helvata TaxID=349315 RepID=A0ABN2JS66_9ACTN
MALAAVAVGGVIAIAAAEGPYEPFESVMGIALAVIFAVLYRPPTPARAAEAWVRSAAAAAAGALVLCLILSFPVDQIVRGLASAPDAADLPISWVLSALWLVGFLNLIVVLRFTLLRVPVAIEEGSAPTSV